MKPLFIVAALITLAVIIITKIARRRKRNYQGSYPETKKLTKVAQKAEFVKTQEDHAIRPESNQQRNLDREVGGLEEGKKGDEKENKKLMERHITDVWDNRSAEVNKVGSINPIVGHDKESMIWRSKKHQLDEQRHEKDEKHDAHEERRDNFGKNYDSRSDQSGGFRQMIKARQDHSNESGGKNDGAWR